MKSQRKHCFCNSYLNNFLEITKDVSLNSDREGNLKKNMKSINTTECIDAKEVFKMVEKTSPLQIHDKDGVWAALLQWYTHEPLPAPSGYQRFESGVQSKIPNWIAGIDLCGFAWGNHIKEPKGP